MRDIPARTLLTGEHDPRDALVTVRAGAGVDATDFAAMVLRMYLRWAERHGHRVDVLETFPSEQAGITSATFRVHAPFAYGLLRGEQGAHRLVRISPSTDGRRQTSFVEVEVDAVGGPGDTGSNWGHQIRAYVLHPYRMVKDLRTGHQVDDPTAVLDGDIDGFLDAGIRWRPGRSAPE